VSTSICGRRRSFHNLNLRRPIDLQTAAYGHFGRPDLDLPWEKTDKAEALRSAAGLKGAVDRELAPLTA
jgi:S-adenosylmethionine synthetase